MSELIQKYNNIKLTTEDLIRQFARSSLLDEDPEKKIRLQQRQKYLREIKAILPDYHLPDVEANKARWKAKNKHTKRKT